jgi:hypothetical protein
VREQQIEHTLLVGGLVPIGELQPQLTPAEDDEVEFVSPSVPGRTVVLHEISSPRTAENS